MSTSGEMTELLSRFARGDDEALGTLLEQERPWLLRHIDGRLPAALRARVGASDIVQLTAVELMAIRDRFENLGASAFRGLLARISERMLARALRRAEVRRHKVIRPREAPESRAGFSRLVERLPIDQTSASGLLSRQEGIAHLERSFQALGPLDRTILRLVYFEGVSYAEASEILGVNEATARQRHHRALTRLREIMRRG